MLDKIQRGADACGVGCHIALEGRKYCRTMLCCIGFLTLVSMLCHGQTFQALLTQANAGDMPSQLAVGKAYYEGATGTTGKRNYSQAASYFQMASNQGSAEANAWLGMCYLYGRGVTRNQSQALSLIQAAANSNNPVALRFLGLMYRHGQGVTKSYATAASYFSRATALNDPNSFDRLGSLYLRGLGVSASASQAASLYNQGAALGDSWSQLHLAELYERGTNALTKDSVKALQLYSQSANNGNYMAAFKAAQRYALGVGAARNFTTAYSYYKIAALKGYPPAQRALGQAFQYGISGNAIDLVHAYVWYSLAKQQGDQISIKRLQKLSATMTAAQISQAQGLLQGWHSNFAMSAAPGSNVIDTNNAVSSTSYTVTISGNNRFNGKAALSVTGVPAGITASFNPSAISVSGSSTLTLSRTGSPATGSYTLAVNATSRKLVHTGNVALNVVTAGTGSVTISGNEESIPGTAGTAGSGGVTVTGWEGYVNYDPCAINGYSCPTDDYDYGAVSINVKGFPPPLTVGAIPAGSYQLTCRYMSVDGVGNLNAQCEKTDGTWPQSPPLYYLNCVNGISNQNGVLTCSHSLGEIPAGTYQLTCRYISVDGVGNLNAQCEKMDGTWQQSPPLYYLNCVSDPYNQNGVLGCSSGTTDSTSYGQGSDATSVANGLAQAINGDGAASVTASASNGVLYLTARQPGAASNLGWQLSASSYDSTGNFDPNGSFANPPSSGTLTGGTDAVYDSGTCSVTINGTPYATNFGQGATASSIAQALASSITSGGVVSASSSGGTLSLTADSGGSGSNYSLAGSCSYNSSRFSSPSFTASTSGGTLTGGH